MGVGVNGPRENVFAAGVDDFFRFDVDPRRQHCRDLAVLHGDAAVLHHFRCDQFAVFNK